jgi:asparagine synthase (glutamine-hydrolysing)
MDLLKIMYRVVPGLSKYLNLNGGKSLSDFLELLVRTFNRQNNRAKFFSSAKFIGIKDRGDYFATISMFDSHLLGILHRNDRMGMMASIESRFPFLDEEMVRFGINLPVKFKYQRSWKPYNHKHPFIIDKAPIRHEAKRGLPTSLAEKKKWGFGVKAHQSLTVKPGFFENGYVSEICSLNRGGAQFMVEEMPQYYVGKLVSVEIFGRLFDYGINPSAINDHLNQYVSMI